MRTKALILVVTVLAIASGLGFYWPFGRTPQTLTLPGVVEIQEVRLAPRVRGQVAEVFVTEGQFVRAKQLLVRLTDPDLMADREMARADLGEAEKTLEKLKNGPRVQEKEAAKAALEAAQSRLRLLQAGSREQQILQAQKELETAEAALKLAADEYARVDTLFQKSAATNAEFDAVSSNRKSATGRVGAARARFDDLKAGPRPPEIQEGEAEVRRLDANHRLLLAGTRPEEIGEAEARVAMKRAVLRKAEDRVKGLEIFAPEDAILEVLSVRPGDSVEAYQAVARVLRAADLWVKVYVPETDLGKVKLNQLVEVRVDSYPDRRFQGKVVQINGESEFTPRNIQSVDERHHQAFGVRVRVDDPQGVFKSGMAAEVIIPLK